MLVSIVFFLVNLLFSIMFALLLVNLLIAMMNETYNSTSAPCRPLSIPRPLGHAAPRPPSYPP